MVLGKMAWRMREAAQIAKSFSAKQTVYDPAEDGFVFSAADLALWMRRASRLETAKIENSPFRPSGQPKASCW
jgi:hypothetical protein